MKKSYKLLSLVLLLVLLIIPTSAVFADTTYVVQPGDTLWGISQMFGVDMADIAAANNLENIRVVAVGQVLVIPGVSGPLGSQTPTPVPPPPAPDVPLNPSILTNPFTVQAPLDTLWEIAVAFGVSVEDLAAENELDNIRVVGLGQILYIPGVPLGPLYPAAASTTAAAAPAPVAAATPIPVAAAPTSPNLLPNPSFEGDWYFYLYNELQVPTGWYIATDEGPNTLDPFNNNLFFRPECRVVSTAQLPASEHAQFVFDGEKTVKVFKGGAPTSFSLFTDVYLQPGTYQMTIRFFADTVVSYNGDGTKAFATDPLAAEARIIKGTGGTGWTPVIAGEKNTMTYTFTVTAPGAVRVGGSFRNRYVLENNGWFLDDWSLVRVN